MTMLLSSCTIIGFGVDSAINSASAPPVSHNQYMSSFKTKSAVIAAYGLPTRKDNLEGVEIWYYSLGSAIQSNATAVRGYNRSVNATSTTYLRERYVEFQFQGSKAIGWRSNGVKYGKEKSFWGTFGGAMIDIIVGAGLLGYYTG